MLQSLKKQWREFRRGRPGHRFQDRYKRNQESRSERSWFTKFLKPVASVALIAVGVVFCFIPGPGLPLIVIGAGLLADISRPIARALDWLELRIRKVISLAKRWWKHASLVAKYAAVILALCLVSGAAYGGFRLVTRM